MRALWVLLLLLSAASGGGILLINKCCPPFQMLNGDGKACVNAPWPRNKRIQGRTKKNWYGELSLLPGDAEWVNRWLPPGLPLDRIEGVRLGYMDFFKEENIVPMVRAVESSLLYDERQVQAEGAAYWGPRRVVFKEDGDVLRRDYFYYYIKSYLASFGCVDAARPPLAPFAVLMAPDCGKDECISKCCPSSQVVELSGGRVTCQEAHWSPANPPFAHFISSELSLARWYHDALCGSTSPRALRLSPEDARQAPLLRRQFHNFLFSTWRTCVDYERHEDGSLGETLFYCEYLRITRGVYWMLRPLCFLSALLLVVALLSVIGDRGNRRKVHSWCLACHAACLLAHNAGQITYYLTLSDEIDRNLIVPPHLKKRCAQFGKA